MTMEELDEDRGSLLFKKNGSRFFIISHDIAITQLSTTYQECVVDLLHLPKAIFGINLWNKWNNFISVTHPTDIADDPTTSGGSDGASGEDADTLAASAADTADAAAADNDAEPTASQANADFDRPHDLSDWADEEMSEANTHVDDSYEAEQPKPDAIPRSVYDYSLQHHAFIFAESAVGNQRSQSSLLQMLTI